VDPLFSWLAAILVRQSQTGRPAGLEWAFRAVPHVTILAHQVNFPSTRRATACPFHAALAGYSSGYDAAPGADHPGGCHLFSREIIAEKPSIRLMGEALPSDLCSSW